MYGMPFITGVLIAATAGLLLLRPATSQAACDAPCPRELQSREGMRHTRSALDAVTVRANVLAYLKAKNIEVFAEFDHAANASAAGLSMPYTTVVVFGNPAVGTRLMQSFPDMALELPLKVLVWQDKQGQVWLSYHDMQHMASMYGVTDEHPVLKGMGGLLQDLAQTATRS